MGNFKFVCREEELNYAKSALIENKLVTYTYFDKSGLTHYLKKLCCVLNQDNKFSFYITSDNEYSVATQIAIQIVRSLSKDELLRYTKSTDDVVKDIIETLASTIDIIPYVNLGGLSSKLFDAIKSTLDVDIAHISDYKIEKALMHMFSKISKDKKEQKVFILIDNVTNLTISSIDFIAKLMEFDNIKILLTIPHNQIDIGIEKMSKLSFSESITCKLEKCFERPNDIMIKGLFDCYNKTLKDVYYNIFERYERNIHIIMACINGFYMDFFQLDKPSITVIKILIILDSYIKQDYLKKIYEKVIYSYEDVSDDDFSNIINKMCNKSFIEIDLNNNVHLNNKLISEREIKISLIEKLSISRTIINILENFKNELTVPQLKFIIDNLDKDYSRRKHYIFILLHKQKYSNNIEQKYLDMLYSFDNIQELLTVCSMYYNLQVYEAPLLKIPQYPEYYKIRACNIFIALLQERLHKQDYCNDLLKLVESSNNIDEECLLVSVLFTAWFNNGDNEKSLRVLNDKDYEYYFEKYKKSSYYHYILRNITYYNEDVDAGIKNYNYCLSKFKNSDPVNYNRTLTNYLGYLLKNINNDYAKIILKNKIDEIKSILEYNDTRYLYLNINYGIYLMYETNENPMPYFDAILYDPGTTETPYIYSSINKALFIAKSNPAKALVLLDEVYVGLIMESNVMSTKNFYNINRLLVEYMNGINNQSLLEEIKNHPLRSDKKLAYRIYYAYSHRFKNNIKYKSCDWKKLFYPGCIFYHGFDIELLFSSFDKPNCKI